MLIDLSKLKFKLNNIQGGDKLKARAENISANITKAVAWIRKNLIWFKVGAGVLGLTALVNAIVVIVKKCS